MSFSIDEQILGFQVSIDDVLLVHVADCQQNLADIEHGYIVAKPPILPEPIKELSSRAKLEDHIDKSVILKGSFERVYERMVQLGEYLFL